MQATEAMLLASIDQTLASARAALAAADDPEQTEEAVTGLSAAAGADFARLPATPEGGWEAVPAEVLAAVARAREAAPRDLAEAERRLTAARELLGGRSR
jgi:hypothetical protein